MMRYLNIEDPVGVGWMPIVDEAKKIIDEYNNSHPELDDEDKLRFFDIKEKFGGLCLYLNYYVPEVTEKIRDLERKADEVCEYCGTTIDVERRLVHGWMKNLCPNCERQEIDDWNEHQRKAQENYEKIKNRNDN